MTFLSFMQELQRKYEDLQKNVDSFTVTSVDNLLKRICSLASRPIADFNKYEALEVLDALHKAAHDIKHEKEAYYRLAFDMLRAKIDQPDALFRNFLLPIFGDKDHEKILDLIAKVEKTNQRHPSRDPVPTTRVAPYSRVRCYSCGRLGHVRANCYRTTIKPRPESSSTDLPNK